MEKLIIGVDIGGSHITCLAIDPVTRKRNEAYTTRNHVDCHASSEAILDAWSGALAELIRKMKPAVPSGIGFAMPGPFNYPGGIALFKGVKKYDSLYGINIREEIIRRLALPAGMPVRFLNDASCFAIGEAWMGEASSFHRTVAITLGTGFGSAFLDDGIPVEKGDEVPEQGCVYHLPFGKSNADDHFSTRWFLARYKESTGKEATGVKKIAEEAVLHPAVKNIFVEFGTNLGNFLAPWLLRFRAECLTIGGNIGQSYTLFREPFLAAMEKNGCNIPVFISGLGEVAAIAGAARLSDDEFYQRLDLSALK